MNIPTDELIDQLVGLLLAVNGALIVALMLGRRLLSAPGTCKYCGLPIAANETECSGECGEAQAEYDDE